MSMIGNYLRVSEDRLSRLLAHPETVMEVIYREDGPHDDTLDIDKSWHVIHFLLNGKTWEGQWPWFGAVLGGTEISDEDVGYGPARYLTPSQVQEVSAALQGIDSEALLARRDADAIRAAELYPEGWQGSESDRAYISSYYELLRTFFKMSAASKCAMIQWLS